MPKKYKLFDVMRETNARERLAASTTIDWGVTRPPPDRMELDERVAWLDLITAAPPGRLERHHRLFIDLAATILGQVRRGEGGKGRVKLLGKTLRDMGLTPGTEPTPDSILAAFKGKGRAN